MIKGVYAINAQMTTEAPASIYSGRTKRTRAHAKDAIGTYPRNTGWQKRNRAVVAMT